jgi:D-alanine-D-alanine ligase
MKITILHNAVADSDTAADRDVLTQVAAVEQALTTLGHESRRLPCTLNLEAIEEALTDQRPDLVLNLVESLAGSDRLAHLAARLLEDLDLRYTGAPAACLHLTTNKPFAKSRLRAAGLPTPDWALCERDSDQPLTPPYIIKAVWEHASLGLDDHAVIREGDGSTVCEQIASRARQLGQACFAEQFIDGREFNLSLIATPDEPKVLPPAEIDFSWFPAEKPRIVGYAAKWEQEATEYHDTPRKFDFPESDAPLVDWLRALAVDCWNLFGLAGYARVDFRVDAAGQPWILEINANPCLSPDAGFAAALARAEVPLVTAVEWIVADAMAAGVRGQEAGIRGRGTGDGGRGSQGKERLTLEDNRVRSTQYSVLSTQSSISDSPLAPSKKKSNSRSIKLRSTVKPTDREQVRRIVTATGLFRPGEIEVAEELVTAQLEKGAASGYEFVFAEQKRDVVGYVCYGHNTVTVSSYDIYWIAVAPEKQSQGIGQLLLTEAETKIREAGGSRIYIETSHRADYEVTRGFYERCGYNLASVLDDFYAPGDSRATYVKVLHSPPPAE